MGLERRVPENLRPVAYMRTIGPMGICPHCSTPLDQLGHMEGPAMPQEWVPENLWRCRNCPYGKNRFTVENGSLEPMTKVRE